MTLSGLGWAPVLPHDWAVVPLRYAAKIGTGHTPDRAKPEYWQDCTIPWVTASDLSSRSDPFAPLLDTEQHVSELGIQHSAAAVHPAGTVMLCRTASVGLFVMIGRPMATTQAFVTWTPVPDVLESRFLLYTIAAMAPEWDRLAYGSTHRTIYMPDLEGLRVPLPPLEEQRRIADFLDAEIARVDRIATIRARQRDALASRWWSVLEAEIPDGTQRLPARRALTRLVDGPFGSAFSSSHYSSDGAAVIRLGNIGFAEYRPNGLARIPMELFARFTQHQVRPGDLLIAGLGDANNHAGRACIAPDVGPAIVKGKCFAATVDPAVAVPEYLALVFSSPIGRAAFEARGSTRQMLNLEIVRSALLPLPPVSTQRRIAEEVNSSHASDVGATAAINRSLDLLAERRQALITAAVSGQFDVTSVGRRSG